MSRLTAEARLERVDRARALSPRRGLEAARRALARPGATTGKAEQARLVRARAHALRLLGRHEEALRDYRAAATSLARAGEPLEAARCAIGAVDALMYLGRYAPARRMARSALARFARAGERAAAARLLNNLANIEYRLDRPGAALALYARARRALAAGRAPDPAALGRVDANRANCLAMKGQPKEAARLFADARRAFERAGRTLDAAACGYGRANLLFLQHRYAEALFALAALEPAFGRLGAGDFLALLDLDASEIYLRLGRPADAVTAAGQAAARASVLGLRYERAKSLYFEGVGLASRGALPEARLRLAQAARGFAREDNRVWLGQCALARAECDLAAGQVARARRGGEAAVREFRRAGDPLREGLAWVLIGRAALARPAKSSALVREAISRARRLARAPGAAFLSFRVACLEGDHALAQRRFAAARSAYRRALTTAESLAGRVQGEVFRATDWSAWEAAYPGLVALEIADGGPDGVFRALERARARAFELAGAEPTGTRAVRPGSGRADAALEARLRALACRVEARSPGRAPAAAMPESWTGPQQQERREVARLLERIERSALSRRGSSAPAPPTLAQARAALVPGELLIEYFALPQGVGALALDEGGEALHANLLPAAALASALEEIRYHARGAAGQAAGAATALTAALDDLARALVEAPLAAARERSLGRAPHHVIVVPSGGLVSLPWPALLPAPVSVVPSVAFWLARRRARAAERLPTRAGRAIVLVGLGDDALPAVEREVAELAALMPRARTLVGREATVARVRRAVADADWLHVAGHGQHDAERPVLSGVRLADRWAYLPDLAPAGRAPRGVVLAACRTGEVPGGFRNDWQGLVGGILRTGARAVLASLWDADDSATRDLSVALYARLTRGASLGQALSGARAEAGAAGRARWNASAWGLFGDAGEALPGAPW
jgi:hypothetical protein